MKNRFSLKNKELADEISITANENEIKLSEEAKTAEIELSESEPIQITAVYQRDDSDKSARNPILRFLLGIVGIVIYIIVGLIMLFDGEKLKPEGFFKGTNPFMLKKTFRIEPTSKTIGVTVTDSEFDKHNKTITEPDILLDGAEIIEENTEIYFRKSYAEKQFRHDLFFTYAILYMLVLVLNILGVALIVSSILKGGVTAIIAFSVLELLFASMFAIPIYLTINTRRLYKKLVSKLAEAYKQI